MLINEIEEAERQAERILEHAREKSSERLSKAKTKSYEAIVKVASQKANALLEKADSEAKIEAKEILSKPKKFSIPADVKRKLAEEIVVKVVKIASSIA